MSSPPPSVVLWWRLRRVAARLPGLAADALRRDRVFRWAALGALVAFALWISRPAPPLVAPDEVARGAARLTGEASAVPPPPPAPGPLPSAGGPAVGAAPATGPIAPGVPLGSPSGGPRDTFGTATSSRGPAAP